MRIKQKSLLNKPDYQYSKLVNGVLGIVQIYHKPKYCVNIITCKEDKVISHCYPITETMYKHYKLEAEDYYHPNKDKYAWLIKKYEKLRDAQTDNRLKIFFDNVVRCYTKRLEGC